MDRFDQLLDLRQGSSSIVEYIIQFCEITYKVPFDEVMLKDIFRFGLNEPIKSCLPAGKFNCSLKDFLTMHCCVLAPHLLWVSQRRNAQSPLQRPLRARSAQSPLQRPLRARSAESAPEAAPCQERAESSRGRSVPGARRVRRGRSRGRSVPGARRGRSRGRSVPGARRAAPEAAPCQERAESAPEAAPCQERAESAPEAAPSQERAESAPEAAPSQELAEFALQPVPPSSPSSPLVPPSSPSSPLVPPSSPSPWILSSLALSERPRDPAPPECPLTFVPPECPLEVVEFTKNFHGGAPRHCSLRPRTHHGPWSPPNSSWLPEAPDLLWPPRELTTSILETICALCLLCLGFL